MTENKRYTWNSEDVVINDNITGKQLEVIDITEIDVLLDLLNEQEELIKRLKTIREEQTETILKQKRKIKELEERNKRQYERLKELTELMYERQWGKLENMVEEWEKADELLQAEWGTYYEDK